MIQIQQKNLEFIIRAGIELSHAMGRMAKLGPAVTFIGSNRIIPGSKHQKWFDLAVETSKLLGLEGWDIIGGGGPGITEACVIGASRGHTESVGIRLIPTEFKASKLPDIRIKVTNPFNRKVLFDLFSEAFVFFPGGFGTLDALFEALTLQQTRKIDPKPIICVGKEFWKKILDPLFAACLKTDCQTIDPKDTNLVRTTDDPVEVAAILREHRGQVLKTKGEKGLASARSTSSRRSQAFAQKVAVELFQAFNTFNGIGDGITIFGSSRTRPGGKIYDETVALAQTLGEVLVKNHKKGGLLGAIITGGGPGNMEAANKGARLAGAPSLGLGIDLPLEQGFNQYVDSDLAYEFKYFFTRKWLFSTLTRIFIATPGGYGTFDELFEMIANRQYWLTIDPTFTADCIYCLNKGFWEEPLGSVVDQILSHGFMAKEHQKLLNFKMDTGKTIDEITKICAR